MKLPAILTALCLTANLCAQTPAFTDPANLRGERPAPLTGRELPIDQGPRGLEQLLRKLNTRASLLLIVAHPDDEDGGMLTLYSRGLGARVAMLTLNRGEGGQNAMTGDFEDALGLIRTQELLSADRYFGASQMFGTEVDFGFSKTKEESFAKWGHERVLYDAVRAIRLYRPLVIASVFIGGVTDGHGQHQVSGQIAQEAFKAAADPTVFPEMIAEGILPWQALKVYARVPMQAITPQGLFDYATGQYTPAKFTNYVTGEVSSTPPSADVVVHEGMVDPLLSGPGETARSYVQFARIGLGLQKSQVSGNMRLPPAGPFDISYHRYGSRLAADRQKPEEESFFDGIDISLEGIATLAPDAPLFLRESLAKLHASIGSATGHFNPEHPQTIAPYLADALQLCDNLITAVDNSDLAADPKTNVLHDLRIKQVQLNDALALALGITFDATAHGADQPTGSAVQVWSQIRSTFADGLQVSHVYLVTDEGQVDPKAPGRVDNPDLSADHSDTRTLTAIPAFTLTITRPYFFRDSVESPVYQLKVPALRNAPQTPPALVAWSTLQFRGVPIHLGRVVHDGDQPISLVPAVSVSFSRSVGILPLDRKDPVVWIESRAPIGKCVAYSRDVVPVACERFANQSAIRLELPPGWHTDGRSAERLQPNDASVTQFEGFNLAPPALHSGDRFAATAVAVWNGNDYREGYRPVGYPGLVRTNFYTPANYRATAVDLRSAPHLSIGYVEGTGDEVFDSLFALYGSQIQHLAVADLTSENLKRFQTVVLGVRTYNAHPELHGAPTQALFDYARNGGNVVVQYQTAEFTADDAPYPLTLGNAEKVVDETDPVQLLDSSGPLLTTPNVITPADFNGWIEERGHGFLRTWDSRYSALTETHDPGQQPQRGGLVTTPLGKGRWTYVAFALYRQLPEAVPGAYRFFLNLLNP